MGGHGGSSGYKAKKAAQELADIKIKVQNGEDIGEPYSAAKKKIYDKYGIEKGSPEALGVISAADELVKEKKNADMPKASQGLPGQNGNPWPPDADANHLPYSGGKGLGVWNQMGKGVANGGVSSDTAKEMYTAVHSFTGSGYQYIRDAQAKGDTTSNYGKKGKVCEDFIAAGVASGNGWTGGPTYRGIDGISDSALAAYAKLKPGDTVDANFGGTASWSTNKYTAFEEFSGGYNSVVFVHAGASQPKGVSIKAISAFKSENEVLVSKDAKFRVQHVAKFKGEGYSGVGTSGTNYLLVYVEDA